MTFISFRKTIFERRGSVEANLIPIFRTGKYREMLLYATLTADIAFRHFRLRDN